LRRGGRKPVLMETGGKRIILGEAAAGGEPDWPFRKRRPNFGLEFFWGVTAERKRKKIVARVATV